MQQVAFAAPLLLGGGLKIIYDGLLWRAFRHLAPPEERKTCHGHYLELRQLALGHISIDALLKRL